MTDLFFVDTNILVYAKDANYPEKQQKAELLIARLWREGILRISCQVIQEYYAVLLRSYSNSELPELIASVNSLLECNPIPITAELQRDALKIHSKYKISWWDSLIVAAAKQAKCTVIYSEDLQCGSKIENIVIKNPFLEASTK